MISIQTAFSKSEVGYIFEELIRRFSGNGAEGLAYLWREGMHAAAARPDLVLLDLNLPKCSG